VLDVLELHPVGPPDEERDRVRRVDEVVDLDPEILGIGPMLLDRVDEDADVVQERTLRVAEVAGEQLEERAAHLQPAVTGRSEAEGLPLNGRRNRIGGDERDVVEVELRVGVGLDQHDLEAFPEIRLALVALGSAILLVLPLVLPPFETLQVSYGLIFGIAALGFNLLLGYTGLLSFGHSAFFGAGAYAAALLVKYGGVRSMEAFVVAGVLASLLVAALIGSVCVRYTRIFFGILALALSQVLWSLAMKFFWVTGGTDGLRVPTPTLLGVLGAPGADKTTFLATRYYYYVLVVFAIFYAFSGLGVTVGFHRLFTHRSFKTSPFMRGLFAVAGSTAIEGPVISWVADHRKHHAFSDQPGDPHSPHVDHGSGWRGALRGLAHAHVGWLFIHTQRGNRRRYAPDLLADPVVSFVDRTFVLWALGGNLAAFLLGWLIGGDLASGLTGLLWGGAVRLLVLHHATFSINSLCHFFGRKRFATDDESRNLAWLSLITFGEAWHNNHHAFPTSAAHGLGRREVDISAGVIWALEKVGLVWDVVRVSPERMARKAVPSTGS